MMQHRRQLLGALFDVLGRPRPASLAPGTHTDDHAQLFAPGVPGDDHYVRGDDVTRMDYVLEPTLTDAELDDIARRRQQFIWTPVARTRTQPAVQVAPASIETPAGNIYVRGPRGYYLRQYTTDEGEIKFRRIPKSRFYSFGWLLRFVLALTVIHRQNYRPLFKLARSVRKPARVVLQD